MPFRLSLIAMPIALFATTPAFAQNVGPGSPQGPARDMDLDKDSITVGGGAVYVPDYEGADHYQVSGAPLVIGSVKGYNFQVIGNRASIDLIANKPGPGWDVQFGPVATLDLNRATLSRIDDPRIRALGKVDSSVEVGGFFGIGRVGVITSPYDRLSVTVSYRKGITGDQRAGILTPAITYMTPLSRKAAVGFFGSADRAERGYARTFFDVDAAQSQRSGLPQFSTRGGWKSWSAGGFATMAITGDLLHGFKLIAGGTYTRLLNDFADSPVVSIAGSKSQWMGAVGVAYTF